jgi:hypothetical protein
MMTGVIANKSYNDISKWKTFTIVSVGFSLSNLIIFFLNTMIIVLFSWGI